MTKAERDAMRKRCEAATPGPWRIRENERHTPYECDLSICGDIFVLANVNGPPYPHQSNNADLIAHSRTDIPACLDHIDKLEGLLRSITTDIEALQDAVVHSDPKKELAFRTKVALSRIDALIGDFK